jgi:membrane protease YdiL (CAAX protease family)
LNEENPPQQEMPAQPAEAPAPEPGYWSVGAAVWMLVLWLAIQLAASILLVPIMLLAYSGSLSLLFSQGPQAHQAMAAALDRLEQSVANGLVMAPLIAVVNLAFLRVAYQVWLRPRRRPVREAIALVKSRFAPWIAVPVALAVGLTLDGISLLIKEPVVPTSVASWFSSPLGAAAMVACLITIVPLTEEAYFRGVLYAAVSRRAGVAAAIVVTSFLFAVVHFGTYGVHWVIAFQAFVIGLTLGILRLRAGSIWPCIVAHATFNLVASVEAVVGHLLAG